MAFPAWDLSDIYRAGVVHNPVPCFHTPGWLPPGRDVLDSLSAGQIALAGDVPLICHRAAARPATLQLFRDVGYRTPTRLLLYETASEYAAILRKLESDGVRVATTHVQAEHALDPAAYWIPRELLCQLNNKGELGRLAPRAALARRECIDAAAFAVRPVGPLPVAVKVADALTSGAGYGVKLCRTEQDWTAAQRELRSAPRMVIEEWLDIRATYCVQFIVRPESAPRFVGSAEQVAVEEGRYAGSWITAEERSPDPVVSIARGAAQASAEMGYEGICGFDVVLCTDGAVRIIDANLRFNGSSVPLSLRPWMR